METEQNQDENKKQEVIKIIKDFTKDILITFPECKDTLNFLLFDVLQDNISESNTQVLINFCLGVFPERILDIMYKNEDIFKPENNINVTFLPNMDFRTLWNTNISDNTKEKIWQYLQLILFSLWTHMDNESMFGQNTLNMFEAMDKDLFANKLDEIMSTLSQTFASDTDGSGTDSSGNCFNFDQDSSGGINMDNLPKVEEMNNHLQGLLKGKLGQFATELAEELSADLGIDPQNVSAQDVTGFMQSIMKDPKKIQQLMTKIHDRMKQKIDSGELKESEIMEELKEATKNISNLKDLKNMPGMEGLFDMMKGMHGGKNTKFNKGAFNSALDAQMKKAKMRENMLKKMEARKQQSQPTQQEPQISEEERLKIIDDLLNDEENKKPQTRNIPGKKKKNKKK